jgi:hypothetical protein
MVGLEGIAEHYISSVPLNGVILDPSLDIDA